MECGPIPTWALPETTPRPSNVVLIGFLGSSLWDPEHTLRIPRSGTAICDPWGADRGDGWVVHREEVNLGALSPQEGSNSSL